MRFSQLLSENNSFLQTENPKCYTNTAAAEALQPITKREEFSMSQKKRKTNEFIIGYKAMVTDYLLYEDCCDYHLKLILAVWDGVTVQEEVKYFSYLTTWGSSQFRDLCVDFGLLACAESVYCDLNHLLGAPIALCSIIRKSSKCRRIKLMKSCRWCRIVTEKTIGIICNLQNHLLVLPWLRKKRKAPYRWQSM